MSSFTTALYLIGFLAFPAVSAQSGELMVEGGVNVSGDHRICGSNGCWAGLISLNCYANSRAASPAALNCISYFYYQESKEGKLREKETHFSGRVGADGLFELENLEPRRCQNGLCLPRFYGSVNGRITQQSFELSKAEFGRIKEVFGHEIYEHLTKNKNRKQEPVEALRNRVLLETGFKTLNKCQSYGVSKLQSLGAYFCRLRSFTRLSFSPNNPICRVVDADGTASVASSVSCSF